MEVYTLNSSLQRVAVIDEFISLIWTDRFRQLGDFKLTVVSTPVMRDLLIERTLLISNSSTRVMIIENVLDSVASDGTKILTVSGNSLEKILVQRVAKESLASLTSSPTWNITNTPPAICRYIFQQICITGVLSSADVITPYSATAVYPPDTIIEPSTSITVNIAPTSVYDAIVELCDMYDMGFRLIRNPTTGNLHFDVYVGRNRTSAQTTDRSVIFSSKLDNLTNTQELMSVENEMTTAYVFSPLGSSIRYAEGYDATSAAGLKRKVLMVDASDLTSSSDLATDLTKRANIAFADHRAMQAFDGEINQKNAYKYGVDYNVGDIVEQRNDKGFANFLRVTEQILTCDAEGDKSYPTLSKVLSITPGSWAAWDAEQDWNEVPDSATSEWADMP